MSPSLLAVPESKSSQRCYLKQSTEFQGLIEHYSEETVQQCLAYFTAPEGCKIPKFKFTNNWGKSELVNFSKGDLKGKSAYFSGLCQWLRKAKTFDATIAFCNQWPGWECDIYFYLQQTDPNVHTVHVEYGVVFSVSQASGMAILPKGVDFILSDNRSPIGLESWLSEASKLGYSNKLDVRAGSAFPKSAIANSVPAAAQPLAKPASVTNGCIWTKSPSPPKTMDKCVYLDYNGTTPIYPSVLDAMLPYLTEHIGNPSSSHYYGKGPKLAVDKSRQSLLKVIQPAFTVDGAIDLTSIVFTGCGTEANNLAIRLALLSSPHKTDDRGLIHVVSTTIEHPAISQCLNSYSYQGGGDHSHLTYRSRTSP